MAENATSHPGPTPAPTMAGKQYIKASTQDDALEPDAMRGSEHLLKEAGVQDDEAERRKKIEPEKKAS